MTPEELLALAAKALAAGEDPAKVDEAVRQVTGFSLSELGERVGARQQQAAPESATPPAQIGAMEMRQDPGARRDALARLVLLGHGASLGIGSKIAGRFPGGDSPAEGRARYRQAISEARERVGGKKALAYEVGGGLLLPGAGTAQALRGTGLLGKAARVGGVGAATGAVGGLGYSEGETPQEIAGDVALGAGVGLGVGTAAPLVGTAARGLLRGVERGARKPHFISGVVTELETAISGPTRTMMRRVRDDARKLGTQLTDDEVRRIAEYRLAVQENQLTGPLRTTSPPPAPAPRSQYDEIVQAQRGLEREIAQSAGPAAGFRAPSGGAVMEAPMPRPPQRVESLLPVAEPPRSGLLSVIPPNPAEAAAAREFVAQQVATGARGPRGGALVGASKTVQADRIRLQARRIAQASTEQLQAELANPFHEDWVLEAIRKELGRRSR